MVSVRKDMTGLSISKRPFHRRFGFKLLSQDRPVNCDKIVKDYPQFAKHMPLLSTYADGASVCAVEILNKTRSLTSMLSSENIIAFKEIGLVLVKRGRSSFIIKKGERVRSLDRSKELVLRPVKLPTEDSVLLYGRIKGFYPKGIHLSQFTEDGLRSILRKVFDEKGIDINKFPIQWLDGINVRAFPGKNIHNLVFYIYNNRPRLDYSIRDSVTKFLGIKTALPAVQKTYYDAVPILRIAPDLLRLKLGRSGLERVGSSMVNLTREQEKAMCAERDKGNLAATEAFIALYKHVVEATLLSKYHFYSGLDLEQCILIGEKTLYEGIAKYAPYKGPFYNYALLRMRTEVSAYFYNKKHDVSLDKVIAPFGLPRRDITPDDRFADYLARTGLYSFPAEKVASEIKELIVESKIRKQELAFLSYMAYLFKGYGYQRPLAKEFGVVRATVSLYKKRVGQLVRKHKKRLGKIIGLEL